MSNFKFLRWAIWGLAAFFYLYEYLLRVSIGVMVPELMTAFHVDAIALGILSALYYYPYAAMQLPVGILMDRFGVRNLLTISSIICGLGTLLSGIAYTLDTMYVGRVLIGVGSSFAFVAMVYVCSHWFEKSKRALLVGIANTIGMLGAFAGNGPLSVMVHQMGWRETLIFWGILGFILALVIYLVIRKDYGAAAKSFTTHETPTTLFEGIKIFCKSKQSWINSSVAFLSYMVTAAIGGLWGVPFIQVAYNVSKETASFAVSMLFIGWMVGGPLIGWISDQLNNRKYTISFCALLTALCLAPIIYWTTMSITWVYVLIFLVGLFSAGELLNFTFATEITPSRVKGASIAVTNCIVSLGSAIINPIIGYILVFYNNGSGITQGSEIIYSLRDYQIALTILPITLIAAWLLSFFMKEKERAKKHPQI